MITEDYVSFEIAKLLKEKGFNGECETSYYISNKGCENAVSVGDFTKVRPWREALIAAPTHQMAMKWLRDVHNIFIVIEPHMYDYINEKNSSYVISLWQGDNYYENITSKDYPTYEDAVEAALKYSLENLI